MAWALRAHMSRGVASLVYDPIVLIGGGNSAGYAVNRWAEMASHHRLPLVVIGEEAVLPYERPALSKGFLLNESVRPPVFNTCVGSGDKRQDDEYYKKWGVALKNSKVTALDVDAKTVTLHTGETLPYSAVVLGTGCAANELQGTGSDLKGVHTLRSLADGLKLVESIQNCKKQEGKAVMIGSGYIGIEVSSALVSSGISDVKVVSPDPWIMKNLFTQDIARPYENYLRGKGIDFMFSASPAASISGDSGHVKSVTLKDGTTLDADLVLIGIGAKPRTELLEGSCIADSRPGGALVDGYFHVLRKEESKSVKRQKLDPAYSIVEGVYAMGDIANFPLKILGGQRSRMEHVQMARESAVHCMKSVVYDLTGDKALEPKGEFDYLPYFYSRFFDLSWKFYGVNSGDCVVVGRLGPLILGVWIKKKKAVGIFLETRGSEEKVDLLKKIARSQPKITRDDLEKCATVDDALELLSNAIEAPETEL